jgi:hypothetical protein
VKFLQKNNTLKKQKNICIYSLGALVTISFSFICTTKFKLNLPFRLHSKSCDQYTYISAGCQTKKRKRKRKIYIYINKILIQFTSHSNSKWDCTGIQLIWKARCSCVFFFFWGGEKRMKKILLCLNILAW